MDTAPSLMERSTRTLLCRLRVARAQHTESDAFKAWVHGERAMNGLVAHCGAADEPRAAQVEYDQRSHGFCMHGESAPRVVLRQEPGSDAAAGR